MRLPVDPRASRNRDLQITNCPITQLPDSPLIRGNPCLPERDVAGYLSTRPNVGSPEVCGCKPKPEARISSLDIHLRRSPMASRSSAKTTTDHEEIRRWAEERGAKPSCVRRTGGNGDIGMIRLDFPGYTGRESLEQISWDEWFSKFDESGLALLYQDTTAQGQKSNFNKLVARETAEARDRGEKANRRSLRARGAAGTRGTAGRAAKTSRTGGRGASTKSAAKKGGAKAAKKSTSGSARGAGSRGGAGTRASSSRTTRGTSSRGATGSRSSASSRTGAKRSAGAGSRGASAKKSTRGAARPAGRSTSGSSRRSTSGGGSRSASNRRGGRTR